MRYLLFLFLLFGTAATAQYAPQAGIAGSTAVPQTSPLIKAWANGCTVTRGLLDIDKPDSGYASSGSAADATGAVNGTVVSLGDSGVAVLTFAQPIANGVGADFAVFENGFPNPQASEEAFLELAFVEVSSDGANWARFPARSLTQTSVQLSSVAGLGYINARQVHNLAGKYTSGYGTPFDLAELAGLPGLNVNAVTHVRLIDVIGNVGPRGSRDDSGAIINDPYPTFFPTGGFDLDAVAVLNSALSVDGVNHTAGYTIYPNPSDGMAWIETGLHETQLLTVMDAMGRVVLKQTFREPSARIDLTGMAAGFYRVLLHSEKYAPWSANMYVR